MTSRSDIALPFAFDGLLHRRFANTYEKSRACYCSGKEVVHQAGCRASRPKCRYMRRVREERRVCTCGMYPFPHRAGSGRCRIGIPFGLELDEDVVESQHALEEAPF